MYYPCSKNKGADQLSGYREADLRLCFRICRLLVFPCGGSNVIDACTIHSVGVISRFPLWHFFHEDMVIKIFLHHFIFPPADSRRAVTELHVTTGKVPLGGLPRNIVV